MAGGMESGEWVAAESESGGGAAAGSEFLALDVEVSEDIS